MQSTIELNNHSNNSVNPEFSKRITVLRFILTVLVVFIHNNLNSEISISGENTTFEIPLFVQIINDTFVYCWGDCAVPMFFMISGYLFFIKERPIKTTIKSKLKSVVIPYFVWILASILFFYIVQNLNFSKQYFANPQSIIKDWQLQDYLSAFWSSRRNSLELPFVGQFWYIRDLIIMMICSPVIKFLASKLPYAYFFSVVFLYIIHIMDIVSIPYGFATAILFYSLGYYVVNKIDTIIKIVDKIRWSDFIITYALIYVLTLYTRIFVTSDTNALIYFLNIIFTICFVIRIAGILVKKPKMFENFSFLSSFSFFVYAAHMPIVLAAIRKIGVKIIPMQGCFLIIYFFGCVIVCVAILVFFGNMLKKYLPCLFSVLNGGR